MNDRSIDDYIQGTLIFHIYSLAAQLQIFHENFSCFAIFSSKNNFHFAILSLIHARALNFHIHPQTYPFLWSTISNIFTSIA